MIHLDTHVVIWLYVDPASKFPPRVLSLIEKEELQMSPMVALEIQMNYEIGRINCDARTLLLYLENRIGLTMQKDPFVEIAQTALHESWTRDPFDRLIVSHAKMAQARLITKDKTIHEYYSRAVWE